MLDRQNDTELKPPTRRQLDEYLDSNKLLKYAIKRWANINPRIDHALQLLRNQLLEADVLDNSNLNIPDLIPYGGCYK